MWVRKCIEETIQRSCYQRPGQVFVASCSKPLAAFGEKVLYLPLKTSSIHHEKAEPRMFEAIWLGINARTEEVYVGIEKGVVKCRIIRRLPEEQRWDSELLHKMSGTPWQPVPGYRSDHVPVEIGEDGSRNDLMEEDNEDAVDYSNVPIEEDLVRHMVLNSLRGYKTRFGEKYGQLVLCCDDKQYWRRDIFPYYKANRKKDRKASGYDWHAIFDTIRLVKEEIKENFPYKVIQVDHAEADDIFTVF